MSQLIDLALVVARLASATASTEQTAEGQKPKRARTWDAIHAIKGELTPAEPVDRGQIPRHDERCRKTRRGLRRGIRLPTQDD